MHRERGASLIELLFAMAILLLICGIAMPDLMAAKRRLTMRASVSRAAAVLLTTRGRAVAIGRHTAIRFTAAADGWTYSVFEDGNANGVTAADIKSGVDRLVEGPDRFERHTGIAVVGFPPFTIDDPDTGRPINPASKAIAFGSSSMCSFGPDDTSTPGTIYVTDGVTAAAIRCSPDGEVHTMWYEPTTHIWWRSRGE